MGIINYVNWTNGWLLLGTLSLLSLGQVLFKVASTTVSLANPRSLLTPSLVAALIIYAIATLLWISLLKRVPLYVAFPFYGLTFLLVPTLAHLMLGEKFSYHTLVGGIVILAGVYIASRGASG